MNYFIYDYLNVYKKNQYKKLKIILNLIKTEKNDTKNWNYNYYLLLELINIKTTRNIILQT